MNRKQRRHDPNNRKKYSLTDVQKAINIALTMKKFTKGHLYKENLKDKCLFCGSSTKTTKECSYWFMTFLDRMQTVLINPSFFTDDEVQALWLQHDEEYQNIKLPLNITDVSKKTEPSAIAVKVDPSLYSPAAGYRLSKADQKAKDEADAK